MIPGRLDRTLRLFCSRVRRARGLRVFRNALFRVRHFRKYPVPFPEYDAGGKADFLLVELPPRNGILFPHGLASVASLLRADGISCRLLDANILAYHRHHSRRLFPGTGPASPLPDPDPWAPAQLPRWQDPAWVKYFAPELDLLAAAILAASPRVVGLSVHSLNRQVALRLARDLRRLAPHLTLLIGGYDCLSPGSGPALFPEFDYLAIGEAEPSLLPLARTLAGGKDPGPLPGIVARARLDLPYLEPPAVPGPDAAPATIPRPWYTCCDLELYRDFRGRRLLAPVLWNRGCAWGRCHFCSSPGPLRERPVREVADELADLSRRGFLQFYLSSSDLAANPETLRDLCGEILRRRLDAMLTGQIKVKPGLSREFFRLLARAGFYQVCFGVDGWSPRTLELLQKGVDWETVRRTLRSARAAGLFRIGVYLVLGIPGESSADAGEALRNLAARKGDFDSVDAVNLLAVQEGSAYYRDPEAFSLRLREDRRELDRKYPGHLPAESWYREDPPLDHRVQDARLRRAHEFLREQGIPRGSLVVPPGPA